MRLDQYLVENGFYESRNKAKYELEKGNVLVNNVPILKASYDIKENDSVTVIKENELKYVSKGGLKLERAVIHYNIDVKNKVCLDIGASTGGFTDYLIQNGAKEVYAVDTGTNQLHESLKNNPKVHSMEKTNFLSMDLSMKDNIDLIVIDVSFVKLETILERVIKEFKNVTVVALIKPQFELGKTFIKNGVVKDPKLHKMVISNIKLYIESFNLKPEEVIESPILGGSGNKEFLISFEIL
ncbi:TlyA family RNA methyltransferase [bacterium]|nr:TlyA family RNA methyltransferase [bacterium]